MQDVYVRLLKNDCRAFTNFHSPHENAIIKFLKITTIRIVLDDYREYTRGEVVYSRRYQDSEQMHSSPETGNSSSQQQTRTELEEEINECLQGILKNKKHATRDAWIYRLHVFKDLQAKEIAALPGLAIEQKTVHNILTFLNGEVKSCLQKKGIGP